MPLPPSKILIALPQTGTQIFGKYIVVRFHSAESPGVLDSADFLGYSALQVGCQFANANRKTTDKINEISIVPNPPNYSIVVIAGQRALHLHFATDNQLAKPCNWKRMKNKAEKLK